MTMGRSAIVPRAEDARSWGEFNARIERELTARGSWGTSLARASAGVLFADVLISCADAFSGGGWWMWVVMLGSLVALGVIATRAVDQADRNRERNYEIARLRAAWLEHLDDRGSLPLAAGAVACHPATREPDLTRPRLITLIKLET
jgi:hypothetical protein